MANVREEFGRQTRHTDEHGNPVHQTGTTGSRGGLGAPGTTGAQGAHDPLGAPGTTGAAPTAAGFDPASYDPTGGTGGQGQGQGQMHRPGDAPTRGHHDLGREHDPAARAHGGVPTGITTTTGGHGTTTGTGMGPIPGVAATGVPPTTVTGVPPTTVPGVPPTTVPGVYGGGYDTGSLGTTDLGGRDIGGREGHRRDEMRGVTGRVKEHLPGSGDRGY